MACFKLGTPDDVKAMDLEIKVPGVLEEAPEEDQKVMFCGMSIMRKARARSVSLSCEKSLSKLPTEVRAENLPSVVGQLHWIATTVAMDESYHIGLAARLQHVEVTVAVDVVNDVLNVIKAKPPVLEYGPVNLTEEAKIVCHSDASWAPKHESFWSTAAHKIYVSDGQVDFPVHWRSKRLSAVCASSAAAEIRAAVKACHEAKMMQMLMSEVMGKKVPLELNVDASVAMTHVKSKFALLPQDRSYVIDVRMLRQLIKDDQWPTTMWWVQGTANRADDITKPTRWKIKNALKSLHTLVMPE